MSLQPGPQDPTDDPTAGGALTPSVPDLPETGEQPVDSGEHALPDADGGESPVPAAPSPDAPSGTAPGERDAPSQTAPSQGAAPPPPAWGAPQAPEGQWPAPPPPAPAGWSSQPTGSHPPGGDVGQYPPQTSGQWAPPPPAGSAPWAASPPTPGGTWSSPAPPPPGHGYAPPPSAGYGGPPPTYPPAGYPPPGYQAVGYPVAGQTDSKAVVGLILAISGWLVCPFFAPVIALVIAGQSNRAIAASGGQLEGRSLNTATKVVAWVNIVLCVLALIALIGLFVVIAATDSSVFTDLNDPSTQF